MVAADSGGILGGFLQVIPHSIGSKSSLRLRSGPVLSYSPVRKQACHPDGQLNIHIHRDDMGYIRG